jgi:hypothetical protein
MSTCCSVHVPQAAPIQDEQDTEHITDDFVRLMSESVILPGVASKTRSRPQTARTGVISFQIRRAPETTGAEPRNQCTGQAASSPAGPDLSRFHSSRERTAHECLDESCRFLRTCNRTPAPGAMAETHWERNHPAATRSMTACKVRTGTSNQEVREGEISQAKPAGFGRTGTESTRPYPRGSSPLLLDARKISLRFQRAD